MRALARSGPCLLLALGCALVAAPARGQEREEPDGFATPPPREKEEPFRTKPGYVQLFATTFVGTGLRFNNPYRLATVLGSDAESLSRTASYVDIGIGATFGNPLGLQHGVTLRTSAALQGVGQVVMTPSYLAWRRWRAFALYGRAGLPLVLTPDVTGGLEASVGGTWFFLGGLGVAAEVVGDVFYGAGTRENAVTTYPVLSGQLGLVAAYEVLP
ncbi:MAG: hypothetical protein KF819_07735 [Labilithrix sp.]|nr:hypothetical protein [Labilithrix sp.]